MLRDYWPDNDLGYHISLARQYALHGTYFWDQLNWAPTGRPNLQGPALHIAVGTLGRLLGGRGDDYIHAFSVLAILQWAAAMFTAVFFARRLAGDRAALFAGVLLSGSIYSAASFFVGVPSGWIFILTPWALHFFLQDRYLLSALVTSLVMYVHLGGASVAPFGIFLAAVLTKRWKGLLLTGGLTAVLTLPYTVHLLRYLSWYTGRRGHVAGSVALLIYLLAVPGLVLMARRWRQHLFYLIWAAAPMAWLFQDRLRFFLQSTIVAAVIAGGFVAYVLQRWHARRVHAVLATALVLVATVFPLSIPTLPIEAAWASGYGFPRELDWTEAKALAQVLERSQLNDRIVNSYYDSLSAAMAVYVDLRQEFGHWGEVRPRVNPAADVPAGDKVYVLPVPPEDSLLRKLEAMRLVRVHGGSYQTSIVTLGVAGAPQEAALLTATILRDEGSWLAEKAVNNRMPLLQTIYTDPRFSAYRRTIAEQKAHAGRIQLAYLVYAHAMQRGNPPLAAAVRRGARGWGSIANFIGDETAIDYLSTERFERFRRNAAEFAGKAAELGQSIEPSPELDAISTRLFDDFFTQ